MILITGAGGQLGTEMQHLLAKKGIEFVATDSKELDITNREKTIEYVEKINPDIIYHCAAYTAVDKAEDEGLELNYLVNVDGSKNIAEAAKKVGAKLVYISTDYVFDGEKMEGMYSVEEETNPINHYGKAKLLGEKAVEEVLDEYYIIRTSWVYGKYGNNFVYTMKRLAKDRDVLTIVADQVGRPTWTKTLAEFMVFVTDNKVPYGLYHLSNDNSCSWYEFAKEILKGEDVEVRAITSAQFPQKATRPKRTVMDLSKAKELGFEIPTWQEALEEFMEGI